MSKSVDKNLITNFSTGIWCGGNASIKMSTGAKITQCFWFIIRSCFKDNYRVVSQINNSHFSIAPISDKKELNIHMGYHCLAVFTSLLIIPLIVLLVAKIYFRNRITFEVGLPSQPPNTAVRFPHISSALATRPTLPDPALEDTSPQSISRSVPVSNAILSDEVSLSPKKSSSPPQQELEQLPMPRVLSPSIRLTSEEPKKKLRGLQLEDSLPKEPLQQEPERLLMPGVPLPSKTFEEPKKKVQSCRLMFFKCSHDLIPENCQARSTHRKLYELLEGNKEPDLKEMEDLLEDMGSGWINERAGRGHTLLARAVLSGHLEAVKKLVEFGAREVLYLDQNTPYDTLLYLALKGENLPMFTYLLEQGADPTLFAGSEYSLLSLAIQSGDLERVKLLFVYANESERKKLANGQPFLIAGRHPLKQAFDLDRVDIFEYLLYQGAMIPESDVWAENSEDDRPIAFLPTLHKRGAPHPAEDLFFRAFKEGKVKILEFLLGCGFPIDAKENGLTALHFAAADKSDFWVEFLLKKGANPQIKNNEGQTYQEYAAKELNRKALIRIQQILSGSKLDKTPFESYTTMEDCLPFVTNGNVYLFGERILHSIMSYAPLALMPDAPPERRGFSEVVSVLIERGADLFAQNRRGETPVDLLEEDLKSDKDSPIVATTQLTLGKIKQNLQEKIVKIFQETELFPAVLQEVIAEYLTDAGRAWGVQVEQNFDEPVSS